jgi:hypothetical protein
MTGVLVRQYPLENRLVDPSVLNNIALKECDHWEPSESVQRLPQVVPLIHLTGEGLMG